MLSAKGGPDADWKPACPAGFHCKPVARRKPRQQSSLCGPGDEARHRGTVHPPLTTKLFLKRISVSHILPQEVIGKH